MEITFLIQIWREENMYVAYTPELDVSSCGKTPVEAQRNLREAVKLFLEETEKRGTLQEILEESGFVQGRGNQKIRWQPPKIISTRKECLSV